MDRPSSQIATGEGGYGKAAEKPLPLAHLQAAPTRAPTQSELAEIQRAEADEGAGAPAAPTAPGSGAGSPITAEQLAEAVYHLMMTDLRRARERRGRW